MAFDFADLATFLIVTGSLVWSSKLGGRSVLLPFWVEEWRRSLEPGRFHLVYPLGIVCLCLGRERWNFRPPFEYQGD